MAINIQSINFIPGVIPDVNCIIINSLDDRALVRLPCVCKLFCEVFSNEGYFKELFYRRYPQLEASKFEFKKLFFIPEICWKVACTFFSATIQMNDCLIKKFSTCVLQVLENKMKEIDREDLMRLDLLGGDLSINRLLIQERPEIENNILNHFNEIAKWTEGMPIPILLEGFVHSFIEEILEAEDLVMAPRDDVLIRQALDLVHQLAQSEEPNESGEKEVLCLINQCSKRVRNKIQDHFSIQQGGSVLEQLNHVLYHQAYALPYKFSVVLQTCHDLIVEAQRLENPITVLNKVYVFLDHCTGMDSQEIWLELYRRKGGNSPEVRWAQNHFSEFGCLEELRTIISSTLDKMKNPQ